MAARGLRGSGAGRDAGGALRMAPAAIPHADPEHRERLRPRPCHLDQSSGQWLRDARTGAGFPARTQRRAAGADRRSHPPPAGRPGQCAVPGRTGEPRELDAAVASRAGEPSRRLAPPYPATTPCTCRTLGDVEAGPTTWPASSCVGAGSRYAYAANAQAIAGLSQSRAAVEAAEQSVRSVGVNRAALEAAVAGAEAAVKLAQNQPRPHPHRGATRRPARPGQRARGRLCHQRHAIDGAGAGTYWVVANLKETQMASVAVGQPARITVDALGGERLEGRVQEISPAAGSEFSILPADNATGNFVKIAQRIPVRLRCPSRAGGDRRLRPGMSVVVDVDTADAARSASTGAARGAEQTPGDD